MKRLVLAAVCAWAWIGAAAAQDVSIRAFYGTFSGGAVAENADSIYFRATARDTDVVIRPAENGFTITWASVIRAGGDPKNPKVKRKETTKRFVPAKPPGLYRAVGSNDPLDGGELGWATVKGKSLLIYLMVIGKDGAYQIQRYERALSGLGMQLTFTRVRDGEQVRTAKGRLVKTAK